MHEELIDQCLKLNGLSEGDISALFEELKNCTSRGGKTILDRVRVISRLCPTWTLRLGSFHCYRVRRHGPNEILTEVGELGYIRDAQAVRLGRANREHFPIMYLAGMAPTAIFETRMSIGQHFTLTEYELPPGSALNMMHVGLQETSLKDGAFKGSAEIPPVFSSYGLSPAGQVNLRKIHARLGDIFTTRDESNYPLSSEIAHHFYQYQYGEGLLYPSVRHDGVLNLALLPGAADAKLIAIRAWGGVVTEVVDGENASSRFVRWEHLRSATSLGEVPIHWVPPLPENAPTWAERSPSPQ